MEISIRGSKVTITEAMKDYAEEKLTKLNKYIENSDEVKANVNVRIPNRLHKVEITIPLKTFILRAEEEQEDFYAAIDVIVDKLERQIRKNKTKLESKKYKVVKDFSFNYIEELPDEPERKIVRRKQIEVKPMDEEEAIIQMELIGHQFYLFKDIETSQPAVVYKRKDGDYGIIELEKGI